jgi:outer membrane receptor for ferrienterochelin and colicins
MWGIMNRLVHRLYRVGSFASLFFVLGLMGPLSVTGQTISGTVTDADEGVPLAGATVVVLDGNGGMLAGSVSDIDGNYSISVGTTGTFVVRARFVGYQESDQPATFSEGSNLTLDFALSQSGNELNTVVVTASRRQEKALDAPASITVLNAEEVSENVGMSSVEALKTTVGVDMAQTGIDRREVVLRGFNNAFSGAAYIMTDYRQAGVPSLNVNLTSIMPNMNIDIDRVEVVRGPGSALYGAGVDNGVIHFITKDAFSSPGTTISLAGGENSYFGAQFRTAGVVGTKKNIGYKITGMYGRANDWKLDPNNAADARQIGLDGGARNTDFEKFNVNGSLEYRFGPNRSLIGNVGTSQLTAAVLSGIGTVGADGFGYSYGQLRLQLDNFFAQVYVNKNSAGKSFVYGQDLNGDGTNDTVVDKGVLYNGQAQYDFSMAGGKQQFIVGLDLELTRPDTEGTILGRNENNDSITELGGYIQSTTHISSRLDLTLAARGDRNNVTDDFTVSPRAALVFKPSTTTSFRVTYNRAFSSPTSNSNFLDIVAGKIPGTDITIRGLGSGAGHAWQRDPAFGAIAGTDLVASSLNPAALGVHTPVGLDLGATYGAMYAGIAAIPIPQLTAILQGQGLPVNGAVVGLLVAMLNPAAGTNVQGFSRGVLGKLNLTTFQPDFVNDLTDIKPLKRTISNTVEVGFKALIGDKLLVAVDGYYTQKEDFVGPLLMETPFVFVPNLSNDLAAAVSAGIDGNNTPIPALGGATLAQALGGLGLSSAQVAGLLVTLAADGLPSASTPVAIVQAASNDPGVGKTPELMLAYRNFGNVDYLGLDASFQYIASKKLSLFANLSWVSDDFFDAKDLGEPGTDLRLALNAPAFKARGGFKYTFESGFSLNASGRYSDGFPISSGPYQGFLDSYFVLDVGFGYDLNKYTPGLRVDVGVSNALDDEHREFIGAPNLGRMGIGRLTYTVK